MLLKSYFWKWYYALRSHNRIRIGGEFCRRRLVDIHVTDGGRISIGDRVFVNRFTTIAAKESVTIGDNVTIGEGVRIYDSIHRFSDPTIPMACQGFKTAPVEIGSDCRIGSHSVILKGVRIGSHSIISSGCVIDFDVPEWTIVQAAGAKNYQLTARRK